MILFGYEGEVEMIWCLGGLGVIIVDYIYVLFVMCGMGVVDVMMWCLIEDVCNKGLWIVLVCSYVCV